MISFWRSPDAKRASRHSRPSMSKRSTATSAPSTEKRTMFVFSSATSDGCICGLVGHRRPGVRPVIGGLVGGSLEDDTGILGLRRLPGEVDLGDGDRQLLVV